MLLKCLALVSALFLSACSFVEYQYGNSFPTANEQQNSFENYHHVLEFMGAPDSIAVLNDAYIFAYHNVYIHEPQFGMNIPYYDLIKVNFGRATAKHNYHFYAFDFDGNCISLSQFSWDNKLGDGSTIGLIFVAEETVDLNNFRVAQKASLWGKSLLIDKELAEFDFEEIILGKRIDLLGQRF